jgi:hypothetical protein
VPVKLDEEEAEISKIDDRALKIVFEKLGFKSLLGRLSKEKKVKAQNSPSQETKENKDDSEQMNLL